MPKAVFEPAITASERSKTVHASDRSATATGFEKELGEYKIQGIFVVIQLGRVCLPSPV
jgi:hypothetical protein